MREQRVAIIGGGISGLAAAERLARLDEALEVHLFEAGERLGGVLQTEYEAGCCLEQGPDSILSRMPAAIDLCRRIGFEQQLVSTNAAPGGVHVVCRGRLQRVPEGLSIMAPQRAWPMVTTPILSWPGKLRLAADLVIPRRATKAQAGGDRPSDVDDETLAQFIRRRLGRETLARLVQPLAGGIYMGDPEQLSIAATFPQFVEMERKHGSLIRAARKARPRKVGRRRDQAGSDRADAGGPQYSLFVAPRRGMAQLIDAVAASLGNCRLHFGQRAWRIQPNGSGSDDGWTVELVDDAGERSVTSWDGVIVALPACQAAPLVADSQGALAAQLSAIPYAGCVVVNLAYAAADAPRPLDSFGFVTPHIEGRSITACTFSHLKYPDRAPDDTILLRAFLGGECFPDVLDWSDEQVLDAVGRDLGDLLGIAAQPRLSRIKRWRRAMPQYHVGHLARVERIEQLVAEAAGLELAGNYFRGVGIPHCITSGARASERLATTLRQQARV